MNIDRDIPEFAMLPARKPEDNLIIVDGERVINQIVKVRRLHDLEDVFQIEEDVLVPDVKPDIIKIVYGDGDVTLEKKTINVDKDDTAEARGRLEVQILYLKDGKEKSPMAGMTARLPFVHRVDGGFLTGDKGNLSGVLDDLQIELVNERKIRVKAQVRVRALIVREWEKEFFEGIEGEEMEFLKERISLEDCFGEAYQEVDICEYGGVSEEGEPVEIIHHKVEVMENYCQVTREKIVVNGFVKLQALCRYEMADGTEDIRQIREKTEFTAFIPLEEGKGCQKARMEYDCQELKVYLTEKDGDGPAVRLEGKVQIRALLLKAWEREVVSDGYHGRLDFLCDYESVETKILEETISADLNIREIGGTDGGEGLNGENIAVYGRIGNIECIGDGGRINAEGYADVSVIFIGEGGTFQGRVDKKVPFKWNGGLSSGLGSIQLKTSGVIREIWAERINSRQVELNMNIGLKTEVFRSCKAGCITKPAFLKREDQKDDYYLSIYTVRVGDSLWSVGKKFKTPVKTLMEINEIEQIPEEGRKILIFK